MAISRWLVGSRVSRAYWPLLVLHLLLWALACLFHVYPIATSFGTGLTSVLPYAVGLPLCKAISEEYTAGSNMNWAWRIFAAASLFGVARAVTETTLADLLWKGFAQSRSYGLWNQGIILLFNCLLIAGLLLMWRAFQRVGMNFKIRKADHLAMASILFLAGYILLFREELVEFYSPYPLARYLQQAAIVFLACGAVLSVVLLRVVRELSGGRLALSLQTLTCFLLLRCSLVALGVLASRFSGAQPFRTFIAFFWELSPWIFLLAILHRANLSKDTQQALTTQRNIRLQGLETRNHYV